MGGCGSLVKNAPGAHSGSCDDSASMRHGQSSLAGEQASQMLLRRLYGEYCLTGL